MYLLLVLVLRVDTAQEQIMLGELLLSLYQIHGTLLLLLMELETVVLLLVLQLTTGLRTQKLKVPGDGTMVGVQQDL